MMNIFKKLGAGLVALMALTAAPAFAEGEDGWYGEGSFSAGSTTGNTETTDLGLAAKVNNKMGIWTLGVDGAADFGEIDGVETRNRFLLGGTADRAINDRLFAFGRASYEQDEFTAYDNRMFVGGGLGYIVLDNAASKWTVRGGPGVKIDKLRTAPAGVDAEQTGFGAFARSEYGYAFNDNVKFTNDTDVLYGEDSTQLGNVIALTANLGGGLAARVSFDVRYDTDPPAGFEDTDTATKVSLVYGFK